MPDKFNEFLSGANTALGQINFLIPLGIAAIRQLYEAMKRDEPELTPEQYIARLATKAGVVKDKSAEWLLSKGYTQDSAGNWLPPASSV